MAGTPVVTIDATGIQAPTYPQVLAWLQEQYRAIYGADVYLEPDSQDGQMVAIFAAAIHDTNMMAVAVYNAFAPSTAQGAGLARVVKVNGIAKQVATNSTVDVLIVGQAGTTITNGVVEDTAGVKWDLPATVSIPLAGEVTVTATAQQTGAIRAEAGSVSKIATPTFGWQSVTNADPAVPGRAVETDAELRRRQAISTALPSLTVLEGTIGAVASIQGVTRYKGYENDSATTDGDGLPAHSIALVVEGGDTQAIGESIAAKKTPGTATYGTTSVATVDRYGVPNTIHFFRPSGVTITVAITIKALSGYVAATGDAIKAALASYISSLDIGEDVLLTKLYGPANLPGDARGSTFEITALTISRSGPPAAANVTIAFNEAASCATGDITLTVV